tara:strand:+ start:392 stop:613 length:222 start_codon:yes stop_codon:yes gene_type:complete
MIVSKMIINSVATYLTKHFQLDKVMSYVFDDNELDKKVKELEKRVDLLEHTAHSPKDFKCNYKENKGKEIRYG